MLHFLGGGEGGILLGTTKCVFQIFSISPISNLYYTSILYYFGIFVIRVLLLLIYQCFGSVFVVVVVLQI